MAAQTSGDAQTRRYSTSDRLNSSTSHDTWLAPRRVATLLAMLARGDIVGLFRSQWRSATNAGRRRYYASAPPSAGEGGRRLRAGAWRRAAMAHRLSHELFW